MESRTPEQLLADWLAGELDEADTARLLQLCREQPKVLEKAERFQSLDRLLRLAWLDAGPDAFVHELAARCSGLKTSCPEPEHTGEALKVASAFQRGWYRRMKVPALFVLGIGLLLLRLGWLAVTKRRLQNSRHP
jgi:hypothetical protein